QEAAADAAGRAEEAAVQGHAEGAGGEAQVRGGLGGGEVPVGRGGRGRRVGHGGSPVRCARGPVRNCRRSTLRGRDGGGLRGGPALTCRLTQRPAREYAGARVRRSGGSRSRSAPLPTSESHQLRANSPRCP